MIGNAPYEQEFTDKEINKPTIPWFEWFRSLKNAINKVDVSISFSDSPYTIVDNNVNITCDIDTGNMIINFPAGVEGSSVRVGNAGSADNDVTINGNGSETIRGLASQTLYDDEILNSIYETTEGWR